MASSSGAPRKRQKTLLFKKKKKHETVIDANNEQVMISDTNKDQEEIVVPSNTNKEQQETISSIKDTIMEHSEGVAGSQSYCAGSAVCQNICVITMATNNYLPQRAVP